MIRNRDRGLLKPSWSDIAGGRRDQWLDQAWDCATRKDKMSFPVCRSLLYLYHDVFSGLPAPWPWNISFLEKYKKCIKDGSISFLFLSPLLSLIILLFRSPLLMVLSEIDELSVLLIAPYCSEVARSNQGGHFAVGLVVIQRGLPLSPPTDPVSTPTDTNVVPLCLLSSRWEIS